MNFGATGSSFSLLSHVPLLDKVYWLIEWLIDSKWELKVKTTIDSDSGNHNEIKQSGI